MAPKNNTGSEKDEAILNAFTSELSKKAEDWHAFYVWISELGLDERRVKVADKVAELLTVGAGKSPNQCMVMGNNDVLMLLKDNLGKKSTTLEALLADSVGEKGNAAKLFRHFDLEKEFSEFVAVLAGVEAPTAGRPSKPILGQTYDFADRDWKTTKYNVERKYYDEPPPLITPQEIAKVERLFYKANISSFIRNQTIYELKDVKKGRFGEWFDEMFISVDQLSRHLRDKYNITADRWLFQHLTKTLDARILKHLGLFNEGERKKVGYSININVSTILSPEFQEYDFALPHRVRESHILEIEAVDLLGNIGEMDFVRQFVASRGYRVCADGVDIHLLGLIDWKSLGVDLIKLRWAEPESEEESALFKAKVAEVKESGDSPQIILCRCGDEAAIDWGVDAGIQYFQGWGFDALKHQENDPRQKDPKYQIN